MDDTTWVQECDDVIAKMKACDPHGEEAAKAFRGTVRRSELFYTDLLGLCSVPPNLTKCAATAPPLPPKTPKCLALIDCCMHAAQNAMTMKSVGETLKGLVEDGKSSRDMCLELASRGDEPCGSTHDALVKSFESFSPYLKGTLRDSCK